MFDTGENNYSLLGSLRSYLDLISGCGISLIESSVVCDKESKESFGVLW